MPTTPAPPQRPSLRRKVLVGFGLVMVVLAAIAVISYRTARGFIETAGWVVETQEEAQVEAHLRHSLMDVENQWRAFLLTNEAAYLDGYYEARTAMDADLKRLPESPRLAEVKSLLREQAEKQQAESVARRRGLGGAGKAIATDGSIETASRIQALLEESEHEQQALLAGRSELTKKIARNNAAAILTGTAIAFLALLVACFMILGDLGARRRAEQALASEHNLLSSIIDTMPDHVFVKDVKGRYILDNASHRRFLGVPDDHILEGRTAADYYPPEIVERFMADDRQVIETGKPVINHELPMGRNGAVERWVETTKAPLRDTDGTIVGLVGVSSDISERKQAEETLKSFAAQLERSNAELQDFASVASHDLQEPLRKIQAFGDRLKAKCSDSLGELGLDYLERMQSAAQRMQALIQDLLKLSRVTTRAQPFERCDLGGIVRDVLSDLEVAIEKKGAKVEVGSLPTIDGDPVQLWQLFQNLIANSLKFHLPGAAPQIRIFSRESSTRAVEKTCEITVQDKGIGFDEQFAERIFVVFQRLHSRDEFEGTGIGLAVCRRITDRHGGRIVAKGAEGLGATFLVTLPITQPTLKAHE